MLVTPKFGEDGEVSEEFVRDQSIMLQVVRRHVTFISIIFHYPEALHGPSFQRETLVRSSASWVRVPESLVLNNQPCKMTVFVEPAALPEGVHYAEVSGRERDMGGGM